MIFSSSNDSDYANLHIKKDYYNDIEYFPPFTVHAVSIHFDGGMTKCDSPRITFQGIKGHATDIKDFTSFTVHVVSIF